LTQKGIEFEPVNYFEQPLTADTLEKLLRSAGLTPQQALRTNEPAYRQFVAEKKLTGRQLIEVMAAHPELIQRPIVVRGSRAVLARPAERLAELGL
jgi:arsenate reductase